MKVTWAILSENAIVDRRTNNVSLIEIIDELTVPVTPPPQAEGSGAEPGTRPTLRLTVLYARSDYGSAEKSLTRIRMVDPGNREFQIMEQEIDLTEYPRVRSSGRLGLSPLPLNVEGLYSFKIEVSTPTSDWAEAFELPLMIKIQSDDRLVEADS